MRLPFPGAGTVVTGDQIAADALRWAGQGYVFGGDASRPGLWDCSSFVSWVLGRDLRLGLPGGKWGGPGMPPGSHGPVVTDYAAWKGAITVQSPARGDLVCFVGSGADGHIGIVLDTDRMVSALDSSQGTLETPITGYGPPGAPIVYRRVIAAAAGSAITAAGQRAGADPRTGFAGAALALLTVGAMMAAVVAAAAVAGLGVVALAAVLAGKAAHNA